MNQDKQPVVALVSLGCPKNLVDSERILADLAEAGCIVAAPFEQAEVIVINTCGFLAAARDEALEVIAEAVAQKQTGPTRRVVVAGCLAQRDQKALRDLADGIDALVGVHDRDAIVSAVLQTQQADFLSSSPALYRPGDRGDSGRFRLTQPHTAYLRIAEGCSRQCAFCTIPMIRGPLRSKPFEMVLAEARELIDSGAVELNLIAQDTTAYGTDRQEDTNLAGLLRQLDALPGVAWLRTLYTYPNSFPDELIETIAGCEHVVPYIDMPLQHIADDVLRRMRRGVRGDDCRRLVETLREAIPDLVLRTAVIVGFPGETDEDFQELLDFVQWAQFEALGVFEYSPEEGTAAADMPDPVPETVRAERAERIMLLQQTLALHAAAEREGDRLEVLVDGIDSDGLCIGRYFGQAPEVDSVCILTEPRPVGLFVQTTVVGAEDYDLVVEPEDSDTVR